MNFKKSLLIALFSFGVAHTALAETDQEKFDRAYQYIEQQNYSAAFPLFKQLAEQGYAEAQTKLGAAYFLGKGIAKDYSKAFYWLNKAAEQQDSYAYTALGILYEKGWGIRQDLSKAKQYYALACDEGINKGCENYTELDKKGIK